LELFSRIASNTPSTTKRFNMGRVGKKLKMIRFKQAMRDIAKNKAGSRVFDLVQK